MVVDEDFIELLISFIDAKIDDAIETHKTNSHGGCYYNYFDSASIIKEEIMEKLKEN